MADNDDLLRGVLEGSGDCIKILDLDGHLQFMSEGGKRVMEVEDFGKLKGCPWPDFWAGAGNADARAAVETAKAGGTARFRGAANTAKGNPRFWEVHVSPIIGEDGKPSQILSISRDITELAEFQEQQKFLTAELQHRIKNSLAMVAAIANQTIRGNDMEAAREAFTARLITLSHAHDILVQTSWTSAPIKDVIEGALAPHRPSQDRIDVSGPEMLLPPKPALAIALAIHELATNAAKYGALSSSEGKVTILWKTNASASNSSFQFEWVEKGGPRVVEPEQSKRGFGTRLIERLLKNDFGGEVVLNFKPDGLVCTLSAPLEKLITPEYSKA
ncbi:MULTISPECIES: sensor histidine kinase [unclassified Bradyrhizobium]|uniref:sensor histidine kinase n=1 Tax=unclassified Bradyrhizobium TaxID=2631580 RepID=UPI00042A6A71|nr:MULTISPECIES: HWE histidine kinase domain-containing protein [unclassified Bradyrhizobium]QIG97318.1 PAS domain-containing protein [Bradyrhizobium sp. 6(2017)]